MSKVPSIQSLLQEKIVKETSKEQIYNIVLKKITEKIVYTNRHTDKTFVIFEVPKILIGYPSYDMKSCILFVINKLSASGYLVEFVDPFYLYIDWGCKKPQHKSIEQSLRSKARKLKERFPNAEIEFVYQESQQKRK
jgi:hypothetical protein